MLNDIFHNNSLQDIEEMAHDLYECMCPNLMVLLGKIGKEHPNNPLTLMKVDGETYSAMLIFANHILNKLRESK
jgi:hypothetical protein